MGSRDKSNCWQALSRISALEHLLAENTEKERGRRWRVKERGSTEKRGENRGGGVKGRKTVGE